MLSCSCPIYTLSSKLTKRDHCHLRGYHLLPECYTIGARKCFPQLASVVTNLDERKEPEIKEEKQRYRWTQIGPDITEEQKQAISQLPFKMSNRCKALMKQIICLSPQSTSLSDVLASWVRIMKPRRADWLVVLKELRSLDHPLILEVSELALLDESFEANIRDYTKLIDIYAHQNRIQDVENTLLSMKQNGFVCDQVILTTIIHAYSKAGNLKLAEEAFEEIKLLNEPPDRRSYGAMIMAYIRAGLLHQGENLLKEMETLEIYAGREVYKALLRAYSMRGDPEGAQRVFDAIQIARISPDAKVCALLINAYGAAGRSEEARIVFENMKRAGLEPTDKCIALLLAVYKKENRLDTALNFLMDLEKGGIRVGKEGSVVLAEWFRRIGVVEEVELVLRDYAEEGTRFKVPLS